MEDSARKPLILASFYSPHKAVFPVFSVEQASVSPILHFADSHRRGWWGGRRNGTEGVFDMEDSSVIPVFDIEDSSA